MNRRTRVRPAATHLQVAPRLAYSGRMLTVIAAIAATGLLSAQSATVDTPDADEANAFQSCVAGLTRRALDAGISGQVVNDVLGGAEKLERVISSDRNQPEFVRTFADYYDRRVSADRVSKGRAMLDRHRTLLNRLQREYGVPPHYLVSFWGLETNFGSYFGNIRTTDALTTLACDQRRAEFFSGELMAALEIIDAGDIEAERMLGSWAGAMGHMQFLPSVFLRYAVDADGDGRRDLWNSVPDALASAANFLRGIGWTSGLRWGREVRLPDSFDFALAGRGQARTLSDWAVSGVTDAFGNPLPALDFSSAILVPAGHEGPAFIAYDNFNVIMRWNRSEYYAIAVGRLADRIAGAGRLTRPADGGAAPVATDDLRELQQNLSTLGFDAGKADGIAGPATRRALAAFQTQRALIADGHVDPESVAAVRAALRESTQQSR